MVGKTRSRWSLAGMTKLQDWDKFNIGVVSGEKEGREEKS
jgi:hypothetical protein